MPDDAIWTRASAVRRFWWLQAVRFAAIALVACGIVIVSGRWLASDWVGYVLLVLGAVLYFLLPRFLSRHWKSADS